MRPRKKITTFLGARSNSHQHFHGEQKIRFQLARTKPAHIRMGFECFPQKHSGECKWRLDILEPEGDEQDAIYVETEEHNHHLDPTEFKIAVVKREAFICVQEDTSTPVARILLDLCKKYRLARNSMSDFAATCRHLEARRLERLSAGAIIPEPEMPPVLPQRLDSATTEPGKLMEEEAPPPASMEAAEHSPDVSSQELEVPPCSSDIDESSDDVESSKNLGEAPPTIFQLGSYEASVPEGGVCEEEEEPLLSLKRVSHGSEEDPVKKRKRDTVEAENTRGTSDLYAQATKEIARASNLRREAEEFRKQTEIAHQSAAQLQQCTADAHGLAEEQLRIAMESKWHAEQLATTNQGIEKKLEWLRQEAEKDRQQAAEMEIKAKELLEEATNLQDKAKEDRRLAAEVLSAVEEQKRLLTEVPKETENDRRKAKEMLAEITALWEQTSHQVDELSATVQQVSQPVEQRSDKPPEIFLDDDPVLPQVPYFEYNLPTHPPDERGIRHNVQKEVVISGPYLNVALQDTAVTAPHGTLPPGPTMCLICCDHLATCVVVPCGHTVLCGPCGAGVQSITKVCPVCKSGAYDMNGKLIVLKLYSC